MKSERKPTQIQLLIKKFVIPEYQKGKYFWSRESKIAKDLIKKYSYEYLQWVEVPFGYKIQSLLFFLTEDGKTYLSEKYFDFIKTKIKLSKEPTKPLDNGPILGDNVKIEKRPKSLQEFLKI